MLLVDRPDGYYNPAEERFVTILAEDLGIPGFDVMMLRYTVLELSTAVKPFLLAYLLEQYDRVCYFDPDIYFYHPTDEIWEALEHNAIVLTPHLTGPLDDGAMPDEPYIMKAGVYNLGFIGLSRHPQTAEFLDWWQSKMFKRCIVAVEEGLFVDQRWVDLVPGRFSSVYIHRDPGCNVAYWNLYHRHVTLENGKYMVNGVPLKFYHFSGFSPEHPHTLSKHQTRYELDDLPVVKRLFEDYAERLRANGYDVVKHWPYAYSEHNVAGMKLPDAARALWRRFEVSDPAWEPPGVAEGKDFVTALLEWLNEPVDDSHALPVTRLAMEVYHQRPDVQRAFPDVLGQDRMGFVRWFVTDGREELELDDFFVRPMAGYLANFSSQGGAREVFADEEGASGVKLPEVARVLWRQFEVSDPAWKPPGVAEGEDFVVALMEWCNEPVDDSRLMVTQLAMEVYRQRPDVQRAFPDVLGRDRARFVRWFVTHGKEELELDDVFVQPMVERLNELPLNGKLESVYRLFTRWLFCTGIGWYIERVLGQELVIRIRRFFTHSEVPPSPPQQLGVAPSLPAPTPRSPRVGTKLQRGVNVVGYLRDETGVGESARATIRALHHHHFPLAWTMVQSYHARKNDDSVLHLPQGHPYDINLFCVNADQMGVVYNELGAGFFAGKYNIGYWFWELDRLPEEWLDRFDYLDEVWVGSHFVQNALARVSPLPVVIMGVEIDRRSVRVTRAMLGLPEDKFIFLFAFDMLSVFERKNPLAVVNAYRRAFGPHFRDTALVIKVTKLDMFPEHRDRLREAVAEVAGILIDGYLDRPQLDGLFAACDAYVSLHRSEGFGMTIAEAMSMGKPVIATDYSGNTDFMNVTNSYPVRYELVELEEDCGPYKKGNVWAEPDVEHAAYLMRRVFENPGEASLIGARAARDIEQWYGRDAMARKIIERLEAIAAFAGVG